MTVTPGYTFTDETITHTKLNSAAAPTVTIDADEITIFEINDTLVAPQRRDLSGGDTDWEMFERRADQMAVINLNDDSTITMVRLAAGMWGALIVKQDGTGSHTLTFDPAPIVAPGGGGTLSLTGTANSIDVVTWVYDGTNLMCTVALNFT